jgi:ATP-dependent Clp protease ATP-binding subunit ClpA
MFDAFSGRSRIVVFVARFAAGKRGSNAIDVEDLLVGLVSEDQGTHGSMLSKFFGGGKGVESGFPTPTHKQFFDPAVAASLLNNIEESVAYLEPIATSTEIPLSDQLSRVFEAAETYRIQFKHDEVEPLHLLAAVFNDEGSVAVKELLKIGLTQEEVFKRLRT